MAHALYYLLAVAVMGIWGSTFVSTKILLLHGLTPASIFLLRFAMAYAGLVIACLVRRGGSRWLCRSWRDEAGMVVAGLTGGSIYFLTENTALTLTLASHVSLIVCLSPMLTALIALALPYGERGGAKLWAGSLISLAGVALVTWGTPAEAGASPSITGNALALAAAALWAVYQHVVRPLVIRYGTLTLTRKVFGYGLVTILPVVAAGGEWPTGVLAEPAVWGNLLFLGLIASLLCYAVWNVVVARLGSIVSVNFTYVNPLVTCVASYLILGERFSTAMGFGAVAILAGLALVLQPARRRG